MKLTTYLRPSIADQLLENDELTQDQLLSVYARLKSDGAASSTLKRLRKVAQAKGFQLPN